VIPPLVSISENGGPFDALGVVTNAVFKDGFTASRLLVYWQLVLMPIAVSLLVLVLLVRSAAGRGKTINNLTLRSRRSLRSLGRR
jgi:hypothetical protein